MSRSTSILALLTEAYGRGGGIAQYNRDLLTALLQAKSVQRLVVLPMHGRQAQAQEIAGLPSDHMEYLPPPAGKVSYVHKAISLVLTRRPDIVFCGHISLTPLALFLVRLVGARLWLQIHGIEAWRRPDRLLRYSVEQVDLVTSVSRHTRRMFLRWMNVCPERVRILPNTVNERFAPGPYPQELAEKLGLKGRKVLLTVSRLAASERYKGHDRVIEALAHVQQKCPDVVYLIVGDGDDRPRLEALAKQTGVADRVIFAGKVNSEELLSCFHISVHGIVIPSESSI